MSVSKKTINHLIIHQFKYVTVVVVALVPRSLDEADAPPPTRLAQYDSNRIRKSLYFTNRLLFSGAAESIEVVDVVEVFVAALASSFAFFDLRLKS